MKWYSLRYVLSLLPGVLTLTGNICGGYLAWMTVVYSFIGLPLLEFFLPQHKKNGEPDAALADTILYAHVLLHTACMASLWVGISSGRLQGLPLLAAIGSTGLQAGLSGITAAHELIHRRSRISRGLGIWNLLLVNYGHFYVEHIRTHHKWVGTPRDPATARLQESVYHFIGRTLPAQYRSALQTEAQRLKRHKRKAYGLRNFVVSVSLLECLYSILLLVLTGWQGWLATLAVSTLAVCILEYVNYIEHYGLERMPGERIQAVHSWNSDTPLSRFTLLELSRHADHHLRTAQPYYRLQSNPESPVLPHGYYGSFYLALFPARWFRRMNPLILTLKK